MKTPRAVFTIDPENNITAHASVPAGADESFSNPKELAKLAAAWPASRLAEIWNSFAGAAPFDDLKPVKKFTDRSAGPGKDGGNHAPPRLDSGAGDGFAIFHAAGEAMKAVIVPRRQGRFVALGPGGPGIR